jgi:hypothetical protein
MASYHVARITSCSSRGGHNRGGGCARLVQSRRCGHHVRRAGSAAVNCASADARRARIGVASVRAAGSEAFSHSGRARQFRRGVAAAAGDVLRRCTEDRQRVAQYVRRERRSNRHGHCGNLTRRDERASEHRRLFVRAHKSKHRIFCALVSRSAASGGFAPDLHHSDRGAERPRTDGFELFAHHDTLT